MNTNLLIRQTMNADPRIASSAMATKMTTTIPIMRESGNESPCRITPLPGSEKIIVQVIYK